MKTNLLLILALLTLSSAAQAQPSTLISYQGYAEDGGSPLDGAHDLHLALFDSPSGGTSPYGETHPATPFDAGVFAVALGGGTPDGGNQYIWDALDFSESFWLEVTIDGEAQAPRTPLRAVPHARTLVAPTRVAGASTSGGAVSVTNTATTGFGAGLYGESDAPAGSGVRGTGITRGVYGVTEAATGTAWGVWGESASTTGRGVLGKATATTGVTFGVAGAADSEEGRGVYGHATNTIGVNFGVYGRSQSVSGTGVLGDAVSATGFNVGVLGQTVSPQGTGVAGISYAPTGSLTYGVQGMAYSSSGRGVYGTAPRYGVFAEATNTTGDAWGVWGESASSGGVGVFGYATAATGPVAGVLGQATASDAGIGVQGVGGQYGVHGSADRENGYGLYGVVNASLGGTGVYGSAPTHGVYGTGGFYGVYGTSGVYGVYGTSASGGGRGVMGYVTANSASASAVFGFAQQPNAYAGYFSGRVEVTGSLSKGGGSFLIDHPLDPEHRILRHSFVESPDMMNVYNGNVTTDAAGVATVTLPEWFEALNRDFRYQLTPIGSFSRAMIAEEIRGNRFVIRSEEPHVRLSWQVTGIRQDAWANENRIVVEQDKPAAQRGRYYHPTAFGLPRERGVAYDETLEAHLRAQEQRPEVDRPTHSRDQRPPR